MKKHVKKYLIDIQDSITNIEEFLSDITQLVEYEDRLIVRRAVERELEIIGEALNRILKLAPEIAIRSSRRIVDLRNRIIHGYDTVDNLVVWSILKRHIPDLGEDLAKLFQEEEKEEE